MQARQHPPVASCIKEGEREALVATGLLEGVVAHQPDPLECLALRTLEDGHSGGELVELARDLVDLVEPRTEHGLEARAVPSPGQAGQPGIDPTRSAREEHDRYAHQHEDQDKQGSDERAGIRLDEGVEVDLRVSARAGRV